jgi:hypothetical protein
MMLSTLRLEELTLKRSQYGADSLCFSVLLIFTQEPVQVVQQ